MRPDFHTHPEHRSRRLPLQHSLPHQSPLGTVTNVDDPEELGRVAGCVLGPAYGDPDVGLARLCCVPVAGKKTGHRSALPRRRADTRLGRTFPWSRRRKSLLGGLYGRR